MASIHGQAAGGTIFGQVKAIVREPGTTAFVVYHPLADAEGGVVKRAGLRADISRRGSTS